MQKIKIDTSNNGNVVEIHLAPLNWVQLHMDRGVIKHVNGSAITIYIVSFEYDMQKIRDNLLALARELNASLEALPEAFKMVNISLRASDIIPFGVGYEKYEQSPAMQGGIIGSGQIYSMLNSGSDTREMSKVTVGMDSAGCSEYAEEIHQYMEERLKPRDFSRDKINKAVVEGQESMCESILKKGV